MHNRKANNQLQTLNVKITAKTKNKIKDIVKRTRFSQGEVVDHAVMNTPLPAIVAENNQQYVELNEKLSHIDQSLGNIGETNDQVIKSILQGISENQIPDNEKYQNIIQELQNLQPSLRQINDQFKHIQAKSLSFLYKHRYHSGQ